MNQSNEEQNSMSVNTGGRVTFQLYSEVRILLTEGTISEEIYEIESEKSDRKGHVILKEKGMSKQIKVHFRRILPINVGGNAAVIESNGKYRAICPKCTYVEMITPSSEHLNCPTHGHYQLYWLGVKPMAETTEKKTAKKQNPEKEKVPKTEKTPKVSKQQIAIDLNALAKKENCELWTRKSVKFDHERINVKAHTLIFTGKGSTTLPRKFCFNTYNDTLGKRSEPLPIEEFLQDNPVKGMKKEKPWYDIADLEKARAKLIKEGYEKH